MRKLTFALIFALLANLTGCYYTVTGSREDTVTRNARVLESRTVYTADGISLNGDVLTISLGRSCENVEEVDVQDLLIESRKYNTMMAWGGVALVAAIGASVAIGVAMSSSTDCDFFGDCTPEEEQEEQDLKDQARNIGIGTAIGVALLSGVVLYFELSDNESETIKSTRTEQRVSQSQCSRSSWPDGESSLMAPSVGQKFWGRADGEGRVELGIGDAMPEMWTALDPLELQLPDVQEWVSVELPDSVRTAGLELGGEARIKFSMSLDDSSGNSDGYLDAGEAAQIRFSVTNNGDSTARDVLLEIVADDPAGLDLESSVKLGSISPGATHTDTLDLAATDAVTSKTIALDAKLNSDGEVIATDRLRVTVEAASAAERVYVRIDADKKNRDLLEAGSTRLQSALTGTRRFKFVSDNDTRSRIEKIVDRGGGNLEDRRKNAIDAARQENISKIFELSSRTITGTQSQLVLTVYNTVSGDRIFLKDAAVDTADVVAALNTFDTLASAYLEWARR